MPRPPGPTVRSPELLAAVIKGCGGTGAVARQIRRSRQLIGALASGKKTTTSRQTAQRLVDLFKVPLDQLFIPPVEEDSSDRKERP
jgi:hypothetical protein